MVGRGDGSNAPIKRKPAMEHDMTKVPHYTLTHNERKGRWDLVNDVETGLGAIRCHEGGHQGVLEKAVGPNGGSVKIQKENGRFQEDRTYPGSADPRSSPG
jgi:hypothetical protein